MPHGSATQCSKWRSDIKFHLVKKAAFFSHSQVAPSQVMLSEIVSETSDQIVTHWINEAQPGLRAQIFGCSQCVFSEVKRVMLVIAVEHLSLRALLLSGAAMETKRTLCSVHTLRRATSSRRTVAPTGSRKSQTLRYQSPDQNTRRARASHWLSSDPVVGSFTLHDTKAIIKCNRFKYLFVIIIWYLCAEAVSSSNSSSGWVL